MAAGVDTVVVGAGVIGLSVAWRAAQRGIDVAVLDRAEAAQGASAVAAGMLAPITEATFGEDELLALNLQSASRYPDFLDELEGLTGTPLRSQAPGTLYVALDRDQGGALRRLFEFQRSLRLGVEWLEGARCRELEPALHPSTRAGILASDDREVDPRALCRALVQALVRAGGTMRGGRAVTEIVVRNGRATGVRLAGGEEVPATRVVLAAGCWSGGIAGVPGEVARSIRPVKGQILRLRPRGDEPSLLAHVVRTEEVYLVPRRDRGLVVGATVEEQGFDTAITAGAVFELLRSAGEAAPGVREHEIVEASAGLRPGTPDNGPLLGPTSVRGLVAATGHFRNGILLAPVTADAVAAYLATGAMPPEAAPFRPERFGATSPFVSVGREA